MLCRKMAVAVAMVLTIAFVCAPGAAHAEDKAKAREAYRRATNAYDFGEYATALEAFKEAYSNFEDANILFNIAQCHRQLGHNQEAIRVYRSYLRHAPKSANSDEVRQIVTRLEKTIEEENANRQQPPVGTIDANGVAQKTETPPPTAATTPASAPAVEAPASRTDGPTDAPPGPVPLVDGHAGRTKRIAGLSVAMLGAAVIVAGIAMEVLAKQTSDQLTAIDRAGGTWDPGKHALGKSYDLAGPVLLGIGGAAVVTGVVVAVLGFKEKRRARVALVPVLGRSSVGAGVRVGF